jgi:hypothetical protein
MSFTLLIANAIDFASFPPLCQFSDKEEVAPRNEDASWIFKTLVNLCPIRRVGTRALTKYLTRRVTHARK